MICPKVAILQHLNSLNYYLMILFNLLQKLKILLKAGLRSINLMNCESFNKFLHNFKKSLNFILIWIVMLSASFKPFLFCAFYTPSLKCIDLEKRLDQRQNKFRGIFLCSPYHLAKSVSGKYRIPKLRLSTC